MAIKNHFGGKNQSRLWCVADKYPKINFIGAHQLHIGWERLGELFDKYPNLYTDTSTGCFLNPDDDFYSEDKEYLRNFFIKIALLL